MNTLFFVVVQQVLMGTLSGIVTDTTSDGPVAALAARVGAPPTPLWVEVADRTGLGADVALAGAALLSLFAAFLLRAGVGAAVRRAVRASGGSVAESRLRLFEREAAVLAFGVGALVGVLLFGSVLSAALCGAAFALIEQGGIRDALR